MAANRESHNNLFYSNIILVITYSILFIFKFFYSIISNSLALQADAYDSLTDIAMYFVALIGIIYSNKKPNEKFPYGYYRIENIISLIFSIFIFITAYNIITESISTIYDTINGKEKIIHVSSDIMMFLLISLTITILSSLYLFVVGKKSKSPILMSEFKEKLFDNLISGTVIVGFVGSLFNFFMLDPIISLIISIFIIKGGYEIFLNSTKILLDAVIDFENRTELISIIESFPQLKKINKLDVRSYGRYLIIELDASLKKNFPLSQLEKIKDAILKKVQKNFPCIFKIILISRSEPQQIIRVAVPLKNNESTDSIISDHYGEASFFAIMDFKKESDGKKLINLSIKENKFKDVEKRKGILISEWLSSEKIDKIYLKKELNKGPKLIYESNLVTISIINLQNLQDIINLELTNMN